MFNFLNCFSHHIFQIKSIAMENFIVNPAKRRRLEYVRRQFPRFNCCSPLLARRRRDNAAAKISDSLEAEIDDSLVAVCESHPDVRMEENDPPINRNVNLLPNVCMEVDLSNESEGDMEAMRQELRERLVREDDEFERLNFEGLARGRVHHRRDDHYDRRRDDHQRDDHHQHDHRRNYDRRRDNHRRDDHHQPTRRLIHPREECPARLPQMTRMLAIQEWRVGWSSS